MTTAPIKLARTMRKSMTPHEVKLWVQSQHLNRNGFHFRRQVPIDDFIVDFAAKAHRIAIEVDGSQHGEDRGMAKDAKRNATLNARGYRVLRFWNIDVDQNMDGVMDTILDALKNSSPDAHWQHRGKNK